MKIQIKFIQPLLVILLIITLILLFSVKSEKDALQKRVDQDFINAISFSMSAIARDYNKLSRDEKIIYYYQAEYGLKSAQDIFYISSYKKYDSIIQALNGLYIYLLEYGNKNGDYEIKDSSYIFDTIWKIVGQLEDKELSAEFNTFIENRKKSLNN